MKSPTSKLNTNNENYAVAYIRVSTKEQETNSSYDVQENCIKEYAKANNLEIIETFKEAKPASGSENTIISIDTINDILTRRPKLYEIINRAQNKEFKHLIVYSIDRFSRNLDEFLTLSALLEKRGIKIHFTKPGENISTGSSSLNKFIEIIKANIASMEADILSSRVKNAQLNKVSLGYWPGGRTPFGYVAEKITNRHTKLKKSNYEEHIIKEIFELYNKGYGYRKISKILNEKHSEMKFTKSKIEYIIKNEIYTGCIVWNRRGGRRKNYKFYKNSEHTKSKKDDKMVVIDESTWNNACKIRQIKSSSKNKGTFNSSTFVLNGLLYCGHCNNPLKGKNYGKNKKLVYRCPKCIERGKSKVLIEKTELEDLFYKMLSNSLSKQNKENVWLMFLNNYIKFYQSNTNYLSACCDYRDKLNNELNQINNYINNSSNLDNIFDCFEKDSVLEVLNTQRILYTKNIESISKKIEKIQNILSKPVLTKEEFFDKLNHFLNNISNLNQDTMRYFITSYINKVIVTSLDSTINLDIELNISKFQ